MTCNSVWPDLHVLALTCVGSLCSSSSSSANRRKFFTVWLPNAGSRKSTQFKRPIANMTALKADQTCVCLRGSLRHRLTTQRTSTQLATHVLQSMLKQLINHITSLMRTIWLILSVQIFSNALRRVATHTQSVWMKEN